MKDTKILGVLGGLGPLATAHFMELVTVMTDADTDQQHLNMIIYSAPQVPDRTAYLLDPSRESPLPQMVALGQKLAAQGAQAIAIPCVTAHAFWQELSSQIPVPVLNGVEETVLALKRAGVTRAGILATDGTISTGIFHNALQDQGIVPLAPGKQGQADVMHLIYENVKAGKPPDMQRFRAVSRELFATGAQAIILGCTELSVIKREFALGPGYIDVMEALSRRAITVCGKSIKPDYEKMVIPLHTAFSPTADSRA